MGAEEIYAAMRQSVMNDWVGGADPAAIGAQNFNCITENLPLRRSDAVLDFGCGIGRTAVSLAQFLNEGGQLVGSDIVPGHVQFCREQFAHSFPNASFHCVRAANPLYDGAIAATEQATPAIDENLFFEQYRGVFDLTVAFSVFTHFDPKMAARYLRSLRDVTKPSGHLFLTWFLDHPSNESEFNGIPARLGAGENFADPEGNLMLALFSLAAVTELAASAGLLIERVSFGSWRGAGWSSAPLKGQHPQDLVILRPT